MTQIDIKYKTCDIRTWKEHLFLDISSTNIDTLVPSLYHCVETRSIEVFVSVPFVLPFQPPRHQRNMFHVYRPSCEQLTRQTLPTVNRKKFIYKCPLQ
jgi:hypothetical protein